MPRIKFITLDFGSSKKRPLEEPIIPLVNGSTLSENPVSTEDRKTQVIQNIDPSRLPRPASKTPMGFTVAVLILAAAITGFSFLRYAGLQKENFLLNNDIRKLNKSIEALEEENKDLALKTERAEKERNKLQDAVDTYKKQFESLQFGAKKNEEKLNSILEEKTYLEDILINKTKEIEQLKAADTGVLSVTIPPDLVQKLNQKDQEISRLSEQNKIVTEKLQRLYQTADEKMKEISAAKSNLDNTLADAKKVIDSQRNSSVDLGSITVNNAVDAAPVVSMPLAEKKADAGRLATKKQGRVLAVNEEHQFVVVDLGKVDGVRNGMELYLKKNGEVIATLSVMEIRAVMTACNIKNLSSNKKIEINDQVSLQR